MLPQLVSSEAGVVSANTAQFDDRLYQQNSAYVSTSAYVPSGSFEEHLPSNEYINIHGTMSSAPELTPSNLPGSHALNQDHYSSNVDVNGFQGMPHLTIAEGLEPTPSDGQ